MTGPVNLLQIRGTYRIESMPELLANLPNSCRRVSNQLRSKKKSLEIQQAVVESDYIHKFNRSLMALS